MSEHIRSIGEIEAILFKHKIGRNVRERILRLNPRGCPDGQRLRGWHANQSDFAWRFDVVGKGKFIREHGRFAWEAMPSFAIRKNGKRAYVDRAAVRDQLWMLP